jgi:hypothetical protein
MTVIKNSALYGVGGSISTPFHTPQEYSESEIEEIVGRFQKYEDAQYHILVSHTPPYKTKLDKTFFFVHVGSKTIRRFIETFQPDISICGHIHEARGQDSIGRTTIINPGPFPHHYAVITVDGEIKYEFY